MLNSMLNATIVEIFGLILGYLTYVIVLDIEKKKRKYVFMVIFMKMCVFNMIMAYIKNMGIEEIALNRITFIANVLAVIAITAALKIISDREYIKIFMSNLIADIVGILAVLIEYVILVKICNRDNLLLIGEKIEPIKIITNILFVIIASINTYISYKVLKKMCNNFAHKKTKHPILWWIAIFAEFLFGNLGYAITDILNINVMAVFYLILMVASILFLYELSLWMRKRKSRQIQQENHILSIENAVMKEYYETLEYQLEQTRKFRHDIDKHMTVIKEMLGTKEQGGEVIDYASNVQSEFKNLKQIEYCKNPVVNAILVNKARQCEEQGIKFDIDIARLELGNIKEIDLIAVLANVLDNAIEECGRIQSAEKQIELKCDVYAENLVIKVSNSTKKTEVNQDRVKTEKKDVYAHGVGLSIVKEVVEKYGGTLEISANGNMFEVVIVMNK